MHLAPATDDLLHDYLVPFGALAGDQRTARLVTDTVRGIIGSESLVCSRIAAFSPWTGGRTP